MSSHVGVRIGIDISSVTPQRSGIGTYTAELVKRLVLDEKHEFVLLYNSLRQPAPAFPELARRNVQMVRRRIPGPALLKAWQYLNMPDISGLTGRVDVHHSPATYIPPQKLGARVTTVHDTDFLREGGTLDPLGGAYIRQACESHLHLMHAVITMSTATARELQQRYGGRICGTQELEADLKEPTRNAGLPVIIVIPHGVETRYFQRVDDKEKQAFLGKHGLKPGYILHVGTREPRKNIPGLLKAYAEARRDDPNLPPLVLAGRDVTREPQRLTNELAMAEHVRFLPYVEHEQMQVLYQCASLFVMPSVLEGFGLPVLEAMASGVPVACSQSVGALEFCGAETAITFPFDDIRQMAASLLSGTRPSSSRDEKAAAGFRIARQLTWEVCAQKTIQVYEYAYKASQPAT